MYSSEGPFELLHCNIADIRFLAKSAVDPKYCLPFVDLLTFKIYSYPVTKILSKDYCIAFWWNLQNNEDTTDREFQQNKIKILNKKYNIHMFSSKVCGGKALAAKQQNKKI